MTEFLTCQREVVETCQKLSAMGFLAGVGGNVALRAPDGHFAVTPSGTDYDTLAAEDICIMTIEPLSLVAGSKKPSVESGLHAAVLRLRPDLDACVHTHQPLASAIALLGIPLPASTPEAQACLGAVVEAAGYGPSGTGFLIRSLTKVLRPDVNAYLLRNHGVVCGGRTMAEAVRNVALLEEEAASFLRSAIGRNKAPDRRADLCQLALSALAPKSERPATN